MRTVDTHGTFDEMLVQYTPAVQALARQARDLIIEIYPDVVEVPWARQRIAGYGVGAKKMSEQFCYIAPQKSYVNLGFYYGAELPDPAGLLEGSGALMRHIKLRQPSDLEQAALRAMVERARHHRMPE